MSDFKIPETIASACGIGEATKHPLVVKILELEKRPLTNQSPVTGSSMVPEWVRQEARRQQDEYKRKNHRSES